MKSVEETTLLTRLEELVAMGKKKKSVLEYKEVMNHLADLDLDPDRIDRIYEYLETQGIDILGNLDAEEEVEKDLDLTLPEGINIDDPVRMYLKEIGASAFRRGRSGTGTAYGRRRRSCQKETGRSQPASGCQHRKKICRSWDAVP